MNIVIIQALAVQDRASVILVLLIVDSLSSEVRTIRSWRQLVDWNKRGLDDYDAGGARGISGIKVLIDFKPISGSISISIGIERISAGVAGTNKISGISFHSIKQPVIVTITVGWVCSGNSLVSVIEAIVISVIVGWVRICGEFSYIGKSILIEITGSSELIQVINTNPRSFPSVW